MPADINAPKAPYCNGKCGVHSPCQAAINRWIAQKVDVRRLRIHMDPSIINIMLDTHKRRIKDKRLDAAIAEASQSYLTG